MHVSSLVVGFILAHWDDIVIFIKRNRTEDEAFDATDRLISYYLAVGIIVFSMIWLSDDPMKAVMVYIVGMGYFFGFIYLIDQRKKKN